jgi:hypothetical protein
VVGTDPTRADTDGDGVQDDVEIGEVLFNPMDSDGDGLIDALDALEGYRRGRFMSDSSASPRQPSQGDCIRASTPLRCCATAPDGHAEDRGG